jgi:AhpD family alkylhydroperoxidase
VKPHSPRTSPWLFVERAMVALDGAIGLDSSLRDLVCLRASILDGCAYWVDMHTLDARARARPSSGPGSSSSGSAASVEAEDEREGKFMGTDLSSGTVAAPGADLYFERRGSGPALLLISGGGGDAGNYSAVAESLADEYTTLTYDRRGNSRSPLRGAPAKLRVEQESDDALAVLEHNGMSSARVFGSSGGAVIGLALATRHPQAVQILVAHEPPVISVLDDADTWFAFFDKVSKTYDEEGVGPALMAFMSAASRAEDEPRSAELMRRIAANWDRFLRDEMRPVAEYVPDVDKLRENRTPLVIAGGEGSRSRYYYRSAEVLATLLGVEFVEFPGHHMAYLDDPSSFITRLREILRGRRTSTPGAAAT